MDVLVVPTIRQKSINEFFDLWKCKGSWDEIIIIEDNPKKSFDIKCGLHYSWKEIAKELGDDKWIISKRDSAIRSFGFLIAYKLGASIIYTLDDDCHPLEASHDPSLDYINKHKKSFINKKWTELVPDCRSRGIPYKNLGSLPVYLNVGLWDGIPDLDAIQMLSNATIDFTCRPDYRIIPSGQYFPMCGMNMSFKREVTPMMYFPLMGKESPYGRFDDIWCGVIFKKIVDHLKWNVSCGDPMVLHKKASNPFSNLVKEAPGIARNESFWETIDKITLTSYDPSSCMIEVGEKLQAEPDTYIQQYGKAIKTWIGLFD